MARVRSSGSAGAFARGARPHRWVWRRALGACPFLRFCRGGLRLARVRSCGSAGAVCAWRASVSAILLGRLRLARVRICDSAGVVALGVRLTLRLCWDGCARYASALPFLSERFALGSRLSFFLCQEKRDGLRYLAFLFRRVEIAIRAFSWCRCGYLTWRVHFGFVRFFMAISTGYRDAGTELRGGRGWRRGLCALLRSRIGLVMLSAGRTLGLRAPDCAKESSTLWTLFTLRRGCVGAGSPRLYAFAQPHWPCESFRREYVGAARPKPAPKSLRLSGLSSRCGGVALVRVRRAVTRHSRPLLTLRRGCACAY